MYPGTPSTDDRLARLLAATEHDAPPPDRAALAAIRERSLAELAAGGQEPQLTHQQRSTMFLTRALIALAATAAAVLAGLFLREANRPAAELTLGEVHQKLLAADSYRAEWDQRGEKRTVWGRGDALRLEGDSPERYAIARGETYWDIDEAENRATPSASPYFSSNLAAADPFQILELPAAEFAKARPRAKRSEGGRELLVYFCSQQQPLERDFEVAVDAASGLPASVRLLRAGGKVVDGVALRFLAFNQMAADPAKFQVPATLTEDGRIGKVTDHQGFVALRPLISTRWTPICGPAVLRPGDWLRTDFQGANAVTVQLAPQTKLILGPGSLAELIKPDQIRLHSGIAEITASPKSDNFSGIVKLSGPAGQTLEVGGLVLVGADERGLSRLLKDPPWLTGYKGTTAKESLGSLVAKIDGREVPLTVGYHQVHVEIRDQIARTTIEESFVNHTESRLEGQFHFPLPADASISGFGMWIGNSLVEADIVEKQRAREIYETILREKRDPGLLEWTGGNIFKARVFPIEAKSEKRIKIVYTQVLPRKGDSYRYSYALQSELLLANPLRQLDLDVTVSSTQPLAKVESPTHLARGQTTAHAARLEFSAQQYTPTRDFEVVVTLAGKSQDVTFIPHQRGSDGYFLLMLQPPAEGGAWQRDVLPDDSPLNLIVLADTSASMDKASRRNQAELIAALLGSLSPKDRFQLAACDVECTWASKESQPADEKNVAAARTFLDKRRSLGWTNLDQAFNEAIPRATPGTQIVYVGDGVVTRVGTTGLEFTQRAAAAAAGKDVSCHAIAVSSSYDQAVLRGIASIGGGSLRTISGEVGPQLTARDLLAELTRPALKNIQLEFKGLQTARVYPRTLPNVPAGTQQIVLGRYLPTGPMQGGEVIVTGTLVGKPVTYRTAVGTGSRESGVGSQEEDASFIPRLWARLHLDELLAQGGSQAIQDEIIALSEEFHIITPYTSLLVLESDADRERFKVKKRMLMSDGERLFAQARDDANYELVQQQMRAAGLWRVALRRQVLAQLASLGRHAQPVPAPRPQAAAANFSGLRDLIDETLAADTWSSVGGPGSIEGFDVNLGLVVGETTATYDRREYFAGGDAEPSNMPMERAARFDNADADDVLRLHDLGGGDVAEKAELLAAADPASPDMPFSEAGAGESLGKSLKLLAGDFDGEAYGFEFDGKRIDGSEIFDPFGGMAKARLSYNEFYERGEAPASLHGYLSFGQIGRGFQNYHDVFNSYAGRPISTRFIRRRRLSNPLPISLSPAAPAAPAVAKERKSTWSAEAQQIARALKSSIDLAAQPGGLLVEESEEMFDAPRGRLRSKSQSLGLHSAKAWLTRQASEDTEVALEWASGGERGVASLAYQLSLTRTSAGTDLRKSYQPGDWWRHDVEWSYQSHTVEIQRPADGQVLLILKQVLRPHEEARVRIDTAKNAVVAIEFLEFGATTGKMEAKDLVEVASVWLPQRIEQFDEAGRLTRTVSRKYSLLAEADFTTRLNARLQEQAAALRLRLPFPALDDAKTGAAAGRATLEGRLMILVDFAIRQLWPEAIAELEHIERLAAGQPFIPWLRMWVLEHARRNDELRQVALSLARPLAEQPRTGDLALAHRLAAYGSNHLQASEQLELLDILRPVYERQPEHTRMSASWKSQRVYQLHSAGRTDEAMALRRELAAAYADERDYQSEYARRLSDEGDFEAAYAWLKAALAHPDAKWPSSDRDHLYSVHAELLREQGRWNDLAELADEWTRLSPEESDAYELYYAALVFTGRYDEADRKLAEWFAAGLAVNPLTKTAEAPLYAAIETAQGDNSYLRGGDDDPQWFEKIAAVIETFVDRFDQRSVVSNANGNWRFRQSDEFKALSQRLITRLKEQAGGLAAGRLVQFAEWILSYADGVGVEDWKQIAAAIRPRWEAATHPAIEQALGDSLHQIYSRIGADERLAFLRLRLAKADDDNRANRASQLFAALIEQPWTAEIEAESFALLDQLAGDAAGEAERLYALLIYLHRWTDRMEAARYERYEQEITEPHKLTRKELAGKRMENRKRARTELSDKLAAPAAARQDGLARWLLIERLYLEIRLERELPKVAEACFELLGPQPPAAKAVDADVTLGEQLDLALRARALAMLLHLATKRDVQAAVTPRLEKYLDDLIAQNPDGTKAGLNGRQAKFALLVVQDRPQELMAQVRAWTKQEKYPQRWQRALAYLHAELGQLAEAIALAEALIKEDAWGGGDYRQLARWQQALGQKEKYEASLVAAYRQYEEYQLRRLLDAAMDPWQSNRGATPGTIDPQVFLIQKALYQKANRPQDYVYVSRSFYESARDFRLLAGLADAVTGQSALNVYPFLGEMRSALDTIDREATADEMVRHIAALRGQAKTAVDRRALDLLEMLSERRAAEVQNQPGPHVQRAIAALQRADKGEWPSGEPRLMVEMLARLGSISQQPLADEVLRVMTALYAAEKDGTLDRLRMARWLAEMLNHNGRREQGIALLESAVPEYRRAVGGKATSDLVEPLALLSDLYSVGRQFVRAEAVLRAELPRASNSNVANDLVWRIFTVHNSALEQGGTTSLGSGEALYQKLQAELHRAADETRDHRQRRRLVEQLTTLYQTAQRQKIAAVPADARRFASELVPQLLARQVNDYQEIVNRVAHCLRQVAGDRDALAFLIARLESEPRWLARQGDSGWRRFASTLAELRANVGAALGDLETRLLAIVVKELRRDLESRQGHNRVIYHVSHSWFWTEKRREFARVAEEVLRTRRESEADLLHIADYLYKGLELHDRAIEILFDAYRQKRLSDHGQYELAEYLIHRDRWGEAVPILESLVERHAEALGYRTRLMLAYFKTKRPDAMLALLIATDKFFHEEDRWSEEVAAQLAAACLDCELFEQTATYYEEAIKRRTEAHGGRTAGDQRLAQYYAELAYAWASLKNTEKAVESAGAAIVCWGAAGDVNTRLHGTQKPLDVLREVLKLSPNLDAYVAVVEQRAAESQEDSAIIRKALGEVYFARMQFAQASAQLKIAAELAPNDADVHSKLVACYDALQQPQAAAEQLFTSVEVTRRDVELWTSLANRLQALGQADDAERARTSLVEMLPGETEGHAKLAELRQEAGRWDDAILHWREVAELRKLEPPGLLALATAQLHQRQKSAAAETLNQLESTAWPARFDEELRSKLPQLRQQWRQLAP